MFSCEAADLDNITFSRLGVPMIFAEGPCTLPFPKHKVLRIHAKEGPTGLVDLELKYTLSL